MVTSSYKLKLSVIPNIHIDGNDIGHIHEYKYLGVYIDVNLNWYYHVNYMANNISQRCGVLKRIRSHLTGETSKFLHNSLALPLFDYCDIGIVNSNCSHLNRLLNLDRRSHVVNMLRDRMWLDVKLHKLHTAVMIYKVKHDLAPPYMTKLLGNISEVNSYNARMN